MSAPVPHGHHDHAKLRERLLVRIGRPRLRHRLGLRPRIDVRHNGIRLRGIEVVGLVHHAVDVGDAVGGLDLVRLRELVSGRFQGAEVGLVQVHDAPAGGVEERGRGSRVHARVVADEVSVRLAHLGLEVEVPRVQQREPGPVQAHPVEMGVVGILPLLPALPGEEDEAARLVHADDAVHVPGALGEALLHLPVGPVEIEVGPAVPLRPPKHVAIVEHLHRARLDVGVQAVHEKHARVAGPRVRDHDRRPVPVPAQAHEMEFLGVVRDPQRAVRFLGVRVVELALGRDAKVLVLPRLVRDRHLALGGEVVDDDLLLGHRFLSGHLIGVGLELRAGVALPHHVHDPQFAHFAVVAPDQRKAPRVLGPGNRRGLAVILLLFKGDVGLAAPGVVGLVGVVPLAVGGEPGLGDLHFILDVVGFIPGPASAGLQNPLVVVAVHHEEVVIPGEDHGLAVGGHARPVRVVVGGLVVVELPQRPGRNRVLEVVDTLAGRAARVVVLVVLILLHLLVLILHFLILGGLHLEVEDVVADEADALDGQMLPVPRIAGDARQFRGDAVVVEEERARARAGIDDVEEGAVGVLPLVPELVGALDPARIDGRGVHHLPDAVGREAGRELVVRRTRLGIRLLRRGGGSGLGGTRRERDEHEEGRGRARRARDRTGEKPDDGVHGRALFGWRDDAGAARGRLRKVNPSPKAGQGRWGSPR